jgi:glycine/D-amino acid oxidase-like deaminating enzyme
MKACLFLLMHIDYLIIGQGISGTWLSYYLNKAGKSFLVIDNNFKNSSSKVAAGIINPVTGRRHVTVWMADEILPFALNAYNQIGNELNITAISQKNIIDFFPSPQMRVSFFQRIEEKGEYVFDFTDPNQFNDFFNYDFGCGEIRPVYIAHLETLLPAWRQQLKLNKQLLEEEFEINDLKVSANKIQYKDIIATAIIFCDGINCNDNPYFRQLPFAPNKGEVLLVEIPELPKNRVYKKGLMLTPLDGDNLWWIGSNYAWEFDNTDPTKEFREKTEQLLNSWMKVPFKIVDHLSGIRPATLERRPFVGFHPLFPNIEILNGMGTKGCSLAPFFARQLADNLLYGKSINPEAEISRFQKILSRNNF